MKLLILSLMLVANIAFAHNPDFSNIIISKTDNGQIILQINSSLTAFQEEVNYINGEGAYQSPEKFQDLVISHFKKNFSIILNENDILRFKDPKVFLGHETKLVAEIIGLPENVNTIHFKNELFKDIHHNQSVVIFLLDGFPKEKYTLDNENSHAFNIVLDGDTWKAKKAAFNLRYLLYLIIPLLVGLLFYFIRKRKRTVA